YLAASRRLETASRRKARSVQALVFTLLVCIIAGLTGFIHQDFLRQQYQWQITMGPSVLSAAEEEDKAAKPGSHFKECERGCPTMIIVPAGKFIMGSGEVGERPQHEVTISRPFAIGKFEVTFAEWDICAEAGACPKRRTTAGVVANDR